jgi:type I restriction enzyme S subunit
VKWPIVTLARALERSEVFVDGDWVESKDQDPEGDVRLIQLADLGDGEYLNKSARFLTSAKARELKCTYLKVGDVLIARMPDPLGRACIFPGDAKPSVTVVDVCIIRPDNEGPDPRWLMHCFNSPAIRNQITAFATGTTRSRISRSNLAKVKIPLPPLPEQRRIAEILDKADALRTKRRAALAQLDTLTQSIFLDMFGDPAKNPKGWPQLELKDLFDIARGGSPRPIDAFITEAEDGINWIMIGDASEGGKYITKTKKRIRPEGASRSRSVKPGDFLLTNSMSFGRPYIMQTSGCIHDGWLVLAPRTEAFEADYFYTLLGSRAVFTEFERRAPGATVKNLNIDLVRSVTVPVAPVSRQREFARAVTAIERATGPFHRSLLELERLFVSLQNRAFRGEL